MNKNKQLLVSLALLPVSMAYGGLVISQLWEWFVVHTFKVPSLSIPAAIGVSVLGGVLASQHTRHETRSALEVLIASFVSLSLIWAVCFVVKQFL